jgi:hypothetical protein
MVAVALLGSVCIAPDENLIKILNAQNADTVTIDFVTYFVSCENSIVASNNQEVSSTLLIVQNVLDSLPSKDIAIGLLQLTLLAAGTPLPQACTNAIGDLYSTTSNPRLTGLVADVLYYADCTYLNAAYQQTVYTGLCGNFIVGVFVTWITQFITSGMLFISGLCIASVVYLQFEIWPSSASDELVADSGLSGDEIALTEISQRWKFQEEKESNTGNGFYNGHFGYHDRYDPSAPEMELPVRRNGL